MLLLLIFNQTGKSIIWKARIILKKRNLQKLLPYFFESRSNTKIGINPMAIIVKAYTAEASSCSSLASSKALVAKVSKLNELSKCNLDNIDKNRNKQKAFRERRHLHVSDL